MILTSAFFSEHLLVAAFYRKTPVLQPLFKSEHCQIFKSTFLEEHLRTAASENMFMFMMFMMFMFIKIYS